MLNEVIRGLFCGCHFGVVSPKWFGWENRDTYFAEKINDVLGLRTVVCWLAYRQVS